MTMNSSGPISLGGATAGQSINLENGQSATAQVSLNDTAVRNLAGVASGAITMPTNFWGKSNRAAISYTFSSNTANASLNLNSISGYSSGKSDITVTINSGVYVYSTTTGGYGLNLSGATTGDTVTIVNNGYIMGKGGGGCNWWNGYYSPGDGRWPESGGPALNLNIGVNPTITNTSGYIGGGGGGGAGGHGWNTGGSGGGGGAGGGNGGGNQGNMPGWGAGPAGGGPGSTGSSSTSSDVSQGGGGGRIMPGTGGAGSPDNSAVAQGGGAGGGGGQSLGLRGGDGGSAGNTGGSGSGSASKASYSGGGGGWGASGGSAAGAGGQSGTASGGKAINLNGRSITWTGGSASSSRVYGAVS